MLVLDANILIRDVLGSRYLCMYADQVEFLAPDSTFQEAREHLPCVGIARACDYAGTDRRN
jgi:hypothetical protein